jgi:hypothetical protein
LSVLLIGLELMIGLIAVPPAATQAPTTYYVDARSGNDRNNGRSPSSAWRTMAQANALVQPGDTVVISSGAYQESIAPVRSGTAQMRITYRAAAGHTVYIEGVELLLNLIQRSYITVQGMTFRNPPGGWSEIQNGHYNEIIGNTFIGNGPTPYYAGLYLYYGSSYNRILSNVFQNWGDRASQWGDAVRLSRQADHNLFEGNRFINGGHSLLGIDTSYNVIRNNYFENNWHKGIDMVWRVNPPWARGEEFVARRNLIENNIFTKCSIGPTGEKGGAGVQMGSAETIFRKNVLVENQRTGVIINGWEDAPKPYGNRLYNNTFVNNGTVEGHPHASAVFVTQWGIRSVDISDNVLKNNIIFKANSQTHQVLVDLYPWENFGPQYYQSYKIAGNSIEMPIIEISSLDGSRSVSYYQQRYPQIVQANLDVDPQFANLAAKDYRLTSQSPCIDAGVPLTNTTSAGSGKIVPVADASYFTDGFGLVPGDQVKIGTNPAILVLNVDVNRNTLTLERAITWTRGDPVYLGEFKGRGADIGAFEFESAPPPPASITVLTPNGGERWTVGQVATIRWNSANVGGKVKIELSRDGGNNFEPLYVETENDGAQDWLASGAPTSKAVIRISSNGSTSVVDSSDAMFSIEAPPSLTVMTPNGGERWTIGQVATIRWNSANVSGKVKIELSRDGGHSFEPLYAETENDGSQDWLVSGAPTSKAMIRISGNGSTSVADTSDAAFSIEAPPPSITVMTPNGGETWRIGQTQPIRWNSTSITGNVKIRLSRDGGRTYRVLFNNVPDTGSIQWTAGGLPSAGCKIEVWSLQNTAIRDQSDSMFTIGR